MSLATSCPELERVTLPLDATQVPEIEDAEPRKTSLGNIAVLNSPIDEALPVAEFLFQYLPGVTVLSANVSQWLETNVVRVWAYKQAWKQVKTHLMEFHGIEPENVDDH